jgi:hypothetical protein
MGSGSDRAHQANRLDLSVRLGRDSRTPIVLAKRPKVGREVGKYAWATRLQIANRQRAYVGRFQLRIIPLQNFPPDDREVMMRLAARIVTPLVVLLAMLLPAGVATAAPAGILRGHELSTDINACNGELIELEGDFQFLTHDELNGLNVTQLTLHAAGIGDQGNRYILTSPSTSRQMPIDC